MHAERFRLEHRNLGGAVLRLAPIPRLIVGHIRHDAQLGRHHFIARLQHCIDFLVVLEPGERGERIAAGGHAQQSRHGAGRYDGALHIAGDDWLRRRICVGTWMDGLGEFVVGACKWTGFRLHPLRATEQ